MGIAAGGRNTEADMALKLWVPPKRFRPHKQTFRIVMPVTIKSTARLVRWSALRVP